MYNLLRRKLVEILCLTFGGKGLVITYILYRKSRQSSLPYTILGRIMDVINWKRRASSSANENRGCLDRHLIWNTRTGKRTIKKYENEEKTYVIEVRPYPITCVAEKSRKYELLQH